ncbi:MAG: HD domain-containing protein [Actinoplanes sp.]
MTGSVAALRSGLDARHLAQSVLADLPERWQHTVGVAFRAVELADSLDESADADILVAAAWLHDIGYAPALRETGFHPLDGARYLNRHGWPARLCGLVAHHSEAGCVAAVRGLADQLAAFSRENSPVSDALTFADQTVGPYGRRMNVDERLADMLRRHGPGSPNAEVHQQRAPLIRAAVDRVHRRSARRHQPAAA